MTIKYTTVKVPNRRCRGSVGAMLAGVNALPRKLPDEADEEIKAQERRDQVFADLEKRVRG